MSVAVFEKGQGIRYKNPREGCVVHGIVMNVYEHGIDVAPVYTIESGVKCYDDEGAVKESHKDNVRLKGCPPPFSALFRCSNNGVYCYSNLEDFTYIKEQNYQYVSDVDGKYLIADDMMRELWDHPWQEQPEKEKTHTVPSNFEDICKKDEERTDSGKGLGK